MSNFITATSGIRAVTEMVEAYTYTCNAIDARKKAKSKQLYQFSTVATFSSILAIVDTAFFAMRLAKRPIPPQIELAFLPIRFVFSATYLRSENVYFQYSALSQSLSVMEKVVLMEGTRLGYPRAAGYSTVTLTVAEMAVRIFNSIMLRTFGK